MIRPVTLLCGALAFGAGVYLYHAKHEVELMDQHINELSRQTDVLRAESRHLLDDWIRLGEPEQLRKYSDEYLGLKTIQPTQFVRMSDLTARLPEARPFQTETQEAAAMPPPAAVAEEEKEAAPSTAPVVPAVPPVSTSLTIAGAHPRHDSDHTTQDTSKLAAAKPAPVKSPTVRDTQAASPGYGHGLPPLQAQGQAQGQVPQGQTQGQNAASGQMPSRMVEAHAPAQGQGSSQGSSQTTTQPVPRAPVARTDVHPPAQPAQMAQAPARPPTDPYQSTHYQPVPAPAAPRSGSLLGMAHGPMPLPAPTPVSATWQGR